jgi:hypothetical protein
MAEGWQAWGLGGLARITQGKTRSISAENRTGEKGKGGMASEGVGTEWARELGQGWKVSPCIRIAGRETATLAEIAGPGTIRHIWMTVHPSLWRSLIVRMYWDGEESASVAVPLGDFFCNGWCARSNVNSLAVAVNPAGGFNCYWEMPFRESARVTVENLGEAEVDAFFYQIDYELGEVGEEAGYLHAQWRRSHPLGYKEVHTILDGVRGQGHYVGTYMARGTEYAGWWGEGEVKFYIDGDAWPTICGTGTEDYFGGAWNFEQPAGQYGAYSTAYLGLHQVIAPQGIYKGRQCFGMYRWHILDPVRFREDLRVTVQALAWHEEAGQAPRYLPLEDDIATTAWWYQREPHAGFDKGFGVEELGVG